MTDDEALDAALATATSPDALHALAEHPEFTVREAVAGNASARRATNALLLDWISGHEASTPRRDISLTELRALDLDSTSVLDDGVIALARSSAFPRLEKLVLSGTSIGNAALLALASSPLLDTLRTLDVGVHGHLPAMAQLREAVARRPGLTLRG